MNVLNKIRFLKKEFPLKILFIAPEAAPFVKAGGLGEVMFALPRSLKQIGYDVRLMIPRYASIDTQKYPLKMEMEELEVPTDAENENEPQYLICNVKKFTPLENDADEAPVTTYFLENQEYYELRSNIYGYADDAIRWALFSRGVLEFLRLSRDWLPDIIFASDWQSGFLVDYLKTVYRENSRLNKIAVIFAIHNLFYQGMFEHRFVSEMDFDAGRAAIPSFFNPRLLKLNMMRRGIMHGDLIVTVSPTYAKEITTSDYGELLDGILRERRSRLYGVLNGIDYKVFNPAENPNVFKHYDIDSLAERPANKLELQNRFGLRQDKNIFMLGIVSRLVEQKGFDILMPVIEPLLGELGFQLMVLGSGDSKYMGFFQDLEKRFRGQAACHLVFDRDLPHLVYAASDAILIPSRFEPSGLNQMEAMAYAAVPIVRRTGGLADSVEDYNPKTNTGTGFVFKEFNPMSLAIAVTRAFEIYKNPLEWQELQKRCLKKDFSWKKSAEEYSRLFHLTVELIKKERAI